METSKDNTRAGIARIMKEYPDWKSAELRVVTEDETQAMAVDVEFRGDTFEERVENCLTDFEQGLFDLLITSPELLKIKFALIQWTCNDDD